MKTYNNMKTNVCKYPSEAIHHFLRIDATKDYQNEDDQQTLTSAQVLYRKHFCLPHRIDVTDIAMSSTWSSN